MGIEENGSFNSNSSRRIFECLSAISLVGSAQPSPNDDAVVSDGAGKVLIIISAIVAVFLFALILQRFGVSFGGLFQTLLNFLPLVRTLLPL